MQEMGCCLGRHSYELGTWASPPLWAGTSFQAWALGQQDLPSRTACHLGEKLASKHTQAEPVATAAAGVGKMITLTSGDLKMSQYTRSPAHAPAEAAPSRTWALTGGCLWRGRREQTYPHAFAAVSPRGTGQAQGTLGQRETASQCSEKSTRNADSQASPETYDIGQGLHFNKTCRGPYAPVSPMPLPRLTPWPFLARGSVSHPQSATFSTWA